MLHKCGAAKTRWSLLLSSWLGASTSSTPGSGGLCRGLLGGGSPSRTVHSHRPPSGQTSRAPSSCRHTGPSPTSRRARAPRWLWPWVTWWRSWRRVRAVSLPALPGPCSLGACVRGSAPQPASGFLPAWSIDGLWLLAGGATVLPWGRLWASVHAWGLSGRPGELLGVIRGSRF